MRRERVLRAARFEDTEAVAIRRRLWTAQGGRCPYCPKRLPHIGWEDDRGAMAATIEHVWPKRLRHKVRNSNSFGGGVILAHAVCNRRKGERAPYPCEILFLAAVNARLGHLAPQTISRYPKASAVKRPVP